MPELETITVELPLDQAEALAQFVKRMTWTEIRACAVDDKEAYEIRAALSARQMLDTRHAELPAVELAYRASKKRKRAVIPS